MVIEEHRALVGHAAELRECQIVDGAAGLAQADFRRIDDHIEELIDWHEPRPGFAKLDHVVRHDGSPVVVATQLDDTLDHGLPCTRTACHSAKNVEGIELDALPCSEFDDALSRFDERNLSALEAMPGMVGVPVVGAEHDLSELARARSELGSQRIDGVEGRIREYATEVEQHCIDRTPHADSTSPLSRARAQTMAPDAGHSATLRSLEGSIHVSSNFGKAFRIATFGESHGGGVGVVVEGCPPRLALDVSEIQRDLDRRRPGQSRLTTPRQEADQVEILSGLFEGTTLGTPIAMLVRNKDARPHAYDHMKDVFRPSHADYTTEAKYGARNWQGGGRASARETIGRVAAGAIARKLLALTEGIQVLAWVRRVQDVEAEIDPEAVTLADVESNIARCPDPVAAEQMINLIDEARQAGDSLGGVVECVARGVPAGLGEPVFDKLEAQLAGALMSLPASKGFEIGSGFAGTALRGSEHNDPFVMGDDGHPHTTSNRSGGIQGGISNGETIVLRVAFKPTATISVEQQTVDRDGNAVKLAAQGRHDPCVLPRAVPMVEAMVCLVLADHWLRQRQVDVLPR